MPDKAGDRDQRDKNGESNETHNTTPFVRCTWDGFRDYTPTLDTQAVKNGETILHHSWREPVIDQFLDGTLLDQRLWQDRAEGEDIGLALLASGPGKMVKASGRSGFRRVKEKVSQFMKHHSELRLFGSRLSTAMQSLPIAR